MTAATHTETSAYTAVLLQATFRGYPAVRFTGHGSRAKIQGQAADGTWERIPTGFPESAEGAARLLVLEGLAEEVGHRTYRLK